MKVRMAVLTASILGLAACASTGETTTSTTPAADQQDSIMDNDDAYMAKVEAIARRRGIGLTWVNPPRKNVAKKDD